MTKSKRIEGLDCDAAAREAIAFVLRAKLERMCQLRDAALDFSDIEGVHKMRVASRRLRSALRDFQPYLATPVSPARLKAVARALGAVRDEDVAVEMVEGLITEADEDARDGIKRLAFRRRARREDARKSLASAVGDAALAELREKFLAQLERATAEPRRKAGRAAPRDETGATAAADATHSAGAAGAAVKEVEVAEAIKEGEAAEEVEAIKEMRFSDAGRRIIRARFRELKESAPSLYRPLEAEPLHEMRIRAKRLRYAVELFTQCWGEPVAPYADEIARLQEYLGELHDCDVWIEDLGARLRRGARRRGGAGGPSAHAAERRAASWLMRHFAKERARHYGKALALWESWEAMGFASSLFAAVEEARARPPASDAGSAQVDGGGQSVQA
jgi:CHAD domain-containing protein